jgi:1-acyl-sn-glycerol-3-phosphate acyltransferase
MAEARQCEITEAEVLAVVAGLARETHPDRTPLVQPGSSLERELGLDSLARVELMVRLERTFGVTLTEESMAGSETPADLLRALLDAARRPAAGGAVSAARAEPAWSVSEAEAAGVPRDVGTLTEALRWHATRHAERVHVVHIAADGEEEAISYGALWGRAQSMAAALQRRDLVPGEAVAIMLPTCPEFFYSFFGILLAGGIPVPIYPPARLSQLEDHLRRHAAILRNAGAVLLVTTAEAKLAARLLRGQVEGLRAVIAASELEGDGGTPVPARPEDIALLQYTSGSTGQPKGVVLTHANLLANIRSMGSAAAVSASDVFVSWLPLYHDMGLISAWLASLHYGLRYVVMSPLSFLARPERWLWTIHRHRGTLSGAPNFAYELCLRKIDEAALTGLDLSSWRVAFNGAEPVSPDTVLRFAERAARYGLRREAIAPVYGLAECAVGLAYSPNRGAVIDVIRREPFVSRGQAIPAGPHEPDVLRFVACGRPLPGHEFRVVDAAGSELPERQEGRLEFRGPSTTQGYFRNPEATRKLFHGDWLDSGDYAYVVDGEIYPTGRAKDIVIKGGRNIYPQELEAAVSNIPGIRKGNVAVFGSRDPRSGSERLVVVAETRETDPHTLARLREAIEGVTVDVLGMPPDEVVVSPNRIVLKTSSGKVRRGASRELFERGGAAAPPAVWLQILHLAVAGVLPQLRRGLRAAVGLIQGAYATAMLVLVGVPTWTLACVLPRPRWSWALSRAAARFFLLLAAIRLRISGSENLATAGPCVLVANHASYLDGLLLVAAMPWRGYQFVAKRELLDHLISRAYLRALGSAFVERFDFRQGMEDATRVAGSLRGGWSPVFFAEGTFTRVPGLREFRMGAFVVAAQEGVPVVPVAIRGARAVLRAGHRLVRPGDVSMVVGEPILPEGSGWPAAVRLRDRARAHVLAHCGEPDLAPLVSPGSRSVDRPPSAPSAESSDSITRTPPP